MKKEFIIPSLKMNSFNEVRILQTSNVPTITNEEAAKAALKGASVEESKTVVITL